MSMLAWERAAAAFPVAPNGVTFRAVRRERTVEVGVHVQNSPLMARFCIEHHARELHGHWIIRVLARPDADGLPANIDWFLGELKTGWTAFLAANPHLQGAKAWRCPIQKIEGLYEQQ